MNDIPVSVPLAQQTRNKPVHTERKELHSQPRCHDCTLHLLDIMPTMGYERTSLVALAPSGAITI